MDVNMNKVLFEATNDFIAETGVHPHRVRMNEKTMMEIQKHFNYTPRGFNGKYGFRLYGMSVEEDKNLRDGYINIIFSDDTYATEKRLMERIIKYRGYKLY